MNANLKRYAVLILTVLLLLNVFAGCKKDNPSGKDKSPEATNSSGTTKTVGTVTAMTLNIRNAPSYGAVAVGLLEKGDQVTILERTEVDGISWGRTHKGWICLLHVSLKEVSTDASTESVPGTTASEAIEASKTALIIVDPLNIRSGPSVNSDKLGEYQWEEKVEILEEKDGWGRTEKGWISLSYVYRADKPDMQPIEVTIIASELNIRKGPSTNYDAFAYLVEGDKTTILKQKEESGTLWGYNGTGWIKMQYTEPVK